MYGTCESHDELLYKNSDICSEQESDPNRIIFREIVSVRLVKQWWSDIGVSPSGVRETKFLGTHMTITMF